ncbi:extensin-like [Gouania willdenowi]|uniref:extensin-like n=1 Tax=Gouania willdenowi TaxID=441366 RepID=UPI0010546D4B|nr:extensin-like [Gouania willdenowi]
MDQATPIGKRHPHSPPDQHCLERPHEESPRPHPPCHPETHCSTMPDRTILMYLHSTRRHFPHTPAPPRQRQRGATPNGSQFPVGRQKNAPQDAPTKDPPPPPRYSAHGARRTQPADQPPPTWLRQGKNHRPRPHTPSQHNSRGAPHEQGPHPTSVTRRTPAHAVPQAPPPSSSHPHPRPPPARSHKPHHPRPPTPKLTHPTQPRTPPRRKPQPPPPVPRAEGSPPTPNPTGEQAPEQKKRRGERDRGTESKGKERQKNMQTPSPTGLPGVHGGGRKEKSNSPASRGHPVGTHAREETPRQPTQATPQAQGDPGLQFD